MKRYLLLVLIFSSLVGAGVSAEEVFIVGFDIQ